jgi:hypothetical protein
MAAVLERVEYALTLVSVAAIKSTQKSKTTKNLIATSLIPLSWSSISFLALRYF